VASTPSPAQPFRNVAAWLRLGQGATSILYVTQDGGHATATWTPAGDHDDFGVQIGGADSPAKGTLVGERYSRALFQQGVRQGLFPLASTYVVSDRDDNLLKLVDVNGQAAWDALVVPVLKANGIIADPGQVERNAPDGLGGPSQPAATPPPPPPPPPPAVPA